MSICDSHHLSADTLDHGAAVRSYKKALVSSCTAEGGHGIDCTLLAEPVGSDLAGNARVSVAVGCAYCLQPVGEYATIFACDLADALDMVREHAAAYAESAAA